MHPRRALPQQSETNDDENNVDQRRTE
jgi:hypothetical protein